MISDTLSNAAAEIRWYRREMPDVYGRQPVKARIESLLAGMDRLRAILDAPQVVKKGKRRAVK